MKNILVVLGGGRRGGNTEQLADAFIRVNTQLPYAITVAVVSFFCYIIAGFLKSVLALPIAILLMIGTLLVIRQITGKEQDVKGEAA